MKFRKIAAMILAVTTVAGGLVYSSTATVTSADYTAEELDSSTYDLRKYTTPYWEGNIVYNECVYPITNSRGALEPFELMYEATEIVSVKNYNLDVTYVEGVDYRLRNGKLEIILSGNIDVIKYSYIHPKTNPDNEPDTVLYPRADESGYEYWNEGSEISEATLVVTYIHNDTWDHPVPETMEASLPNTMEKLMNKEAMTIVVAGDSVSTGANSSNFLGISPYADAYPEMTAKALAEKYGNDNIKLVNSAIGGTMSYFDQTKMDNTIIQYAPDLVILNFGMNDSSCDRVGISAEEFSSNMEQQIEYIKEKLPDCEILLLSSLYGNIYTFPAERYEEHANVLHELADKWDGVGVADPQMVEKSLLDKKDYICFMADNMVHPNDYGMRLMAQSILAALDVSDIDSYKELMIDNLTEYASPDDHVEDGKKEELIARIAQAESDISHLTDEWDISEVVDETYADIEFILGRCTMDCHVFNNTIIKPTCKTDGHTHSVCTVCGYEYDHTEVKAYGGEHIMDGGRQTTSPTYKTEGVTTYTCAKCGYEEYETIPALDNPPTYTDKGMLYVNGYNYMQGDAHPYRSGSGYVELDVCPLDLDFDGTPYIGVWFSGYAVTACYNFRAQQVEIINTSLPYAGGTPYISKKVPWSTDNGEYEYNWKKFAVQLTGNTVSIYLDGECVLTDTNSLYRADGEVALVYSVGEFYLDNFKAGGSNYDLSTGIGDYMIYSDLDSDAAQSNFRKTWGINYSDNKIIDANALNITTGKYKHTHQVSYLNTVERGCNLCGYNEYICDICGYIVQMDQKDPIYEEGHTLIKKSVGLEPSSSNDGYFSYKCETCYMTFKERIPAGTELDYVLTGDLNSDGIVNFIDIVCMRSILVGNDDFTFNSKAADINGDGNVDLVDMLLIKRIK